jgi:hypothetical protein
VLRIEDAISSPLRSYFGISALKLSVRIVCQNKSLISTTKHAVKM